MSGDGARLGAWLDGELVDVDRELGDRIRTSLAAGWQSMSLESAPRTLCDAAVVLLRHTLAQGCETRDAAVSLLTVDALVTLACGALADSGSDVGTGVMAMLTELTATLPQPDDAA